MTFLEVTVVFLGSVLILFAFLSVLGKVLMSLDAIVSRRNYSFDFRFDGLYTALGLAGILYVTLL